MQTLEEKTVLTVREAAELLRVNVKTIYAFIAAKRIPVLRIGRSIRISRHVIASMLEQGHVAPSGGIHAGRTRR
jgi:excisionase family DNA binding protein